MIPVEEQHIGIMYVDFGAKFALFFFLLGVYILSLLLGTFVVCGGSCCCCFVQKSSNKQFFFVFFLGVCWACYLFPHH
jgi:hypothetical protein